VCAAVTVSIAHACVHVSGPCGPAPASPVENEQTPTPEVGQWATETGAGRPLSPSAHSPAPQVQEHNGHVFASYQVSIPQSCEQCLSYIWLMDKALLCSGECHAPSCSRPSLQPPTSPV
jgi:hypothetical protein